MLRLTEMIVVFLLAALSAAQAEATTFYVSPGGSDRNAGTLAAPFATIQQARDAIRTLKTAGGYTTPVTVYLRAGTYRQTAAIQLTSQDSGTAAKPITYQAYAGEAVRISGGVPIKTTWTLYRGSIWKTNVGTMRFNSLWVNGARAIRARSPNTDAYYALSTATYNTFTTSASGQVNAAWKNLTRVEIVSYASWEQSRIPIASVAGNTVTLAGKRATPWNVWHGQRWFAENALELLDSPGEWYLDKTTGDLYYYPRTGEVLGTVEVIAPAVTGTLWKMDLANYITLSGLTFEHTDWTLSSTGYPGGQAAWTPTKTSRSATVSLCSTNYCTITACTIRHTGSTYACEMYARDTVGAYGQNNSVTRNELADLGGGGIVIGQDYYPGNICHGLNGAEKITDNRIHDYGLVWREACGVLVLLSSGNQIAHNDIYNGAYDGISLGWMWTADDSDCKANVVEYNRVHSVMAELNDGAGIYCVGKQPGTVIRYNYIYDLTVSRQKPAQPVYYYAIYGIYLDQASTSISVTNNVITHTAHASLYLHSAGANSIVNNVLSDGYGALYAHEDGSGRGGTTLSKNILYETNATAWSVQFDAANSGIASSDYNCIFSKTPGTDWTKGLAAWKAKGYEAHSQFADPQFMNWAGRNFAVQSTSPALKVGYVPIDLTGVGPRSGSSGG